MNLVQKNQLGRIYVDEFTVSKTVYRYIEEYSSNYDVIDVKFVDNILTVRLNNAIDYQIADIENLQLAAKKLIKNKIGLYIQELNIVLG